MSTPKRKPIFMKVDQLRPGTTGHNLVVKVVSCKVVVNRTRPDGSSVRIAECTVGDETGTITLTARNAQVDLMVADKTINVRNAKIDMYKGSMRLAVDKWGLIEASETTLDEPVKVDYDLSAVEYELVPATED